MMKISIKLMFTDKVLFEGEYESTKDALVDAVKKGAYLQGAYLQGADLRGADLRGADLRGAYLQGAYLQGAYLRGADLRGADLQGADLRGADLQGAGEAKKNLLKGKTPVLQIGPIGSREDYLMAYNSEDGIFLQAGCFFGDVKKFTLGLKARHKSGRYLKEYKAALSLISATFKARDGDKS